MCQEKLQTSFIKSFLLVFTSIIVAACSFQPLYMVDSTVDKRFTIQPNIKISTLSTRNGVILKNYLIDILKPSTKSPYSLTINFSEGISDIGIRKDETSGRKKTTVNAIITLFDNKTNTVVYNYTVNTVNAFTLQERKYYAAQKAQDFATQQNLLELANKISLHLNIYFSTLP